MPFDLRGWLATVVELIDVGRDAMSLQPQAADLAPALIGTRIAIAIIFLAGVLAIVNRWLWTITSGTPRRIGFDEVPVVLPVRRPARRRRRSPSGERVFAAARVGCGGR